MAAIAELAPASDQHRRQKAPPRPGLSRRVLLIDDERDTVDTLRILLELYGFEVRTAYTGLDGLYVARAFVPRVVICDLAMPGLDGFAVCRQLRQDPAFRGTFLIAVSGYGTAADRRNAHAAGFDLHLLKPVAPAVLVWVLRRLCRPAVSAF
jgi:CheY-like chemotaxis protein